MAPSVSPSPASARSSSSDSERPVELEEGDYLISEQEEKGGGYSSLFVDEAGGKSLDGAWAGTQKTDGRRTTRRNLLLAGLVVGAALGGWLGGSTYAGKGFLTTFGAGSSELDEKLVP